MAKVVRIYYNKGQTILKEKYYKVNGKKEGNYKLYFWLIKELEEICNYINDKKNGEYKSYNEDGELCEKHNYSNGIKQY